MVALVAAVALAVVVFLAFHGVPAAVAVYALATDSPRADTACAVLVLLFVSRSAGGVLRKLGEAPGGGR